MLKKFISCVNLNINADIFLGGLKRILCDLMQTTSTMVSSFNKSLIVLCDHRSAENTKGELFKIRCGNNLKLGGNKSRGVLTFPFMKGAV